MNRPLPFLFLLFCAISVGTAQEPIIHTVNFPSGDLSWKVEFTRNVAPGQTAKSSDSEVKSIDSTRVAGVRRDVSHWADGSNTETWWMYKLGLALVQGKQTPAIRGIKMSQLAPRRFDESSFAWIDASTFRGEETFKGKKVLRYEYETVEDDNSKSKSYALIDAKTKSPVVLCTGSQIAAFEISDTIPVGELIMPESFRESLKKYESYYTPAKKLGKR